MNTFEVKDMTCGHCVGTITRALTAADPAVRLTIDLPSHRVSIESRVVDGKAAADIIREAGYTPEPVAG